MWISKMNYKLKIKLHHTHQETVDNGLMICQKKSKKVVVVDIIGQMLDQDQKIGIMHIPIEFIKNPKISQDHLMIILNLREKLKKITKKLTILKGKPKKQKTLLLLLRMLKLLMLLQPRLKRLNQQKRKLKRSSQQLLRLQRPTIKPLKHQPLPKQRLLQLPPKVKLKRKKRLRKLQLPKRKFKLKLMLKKVRVNPILIPIPTPLILTVIDRYSNNFYNI